MVEGAEVFLYSFNHSLTSMLFEQEAFVIPYPPRVDLVPSYAGWSIWAPTALDRHLLCALPATAASARVDHAAECLLAECLWAEQWEGVDGE
jgi:hypothetical protein